MTEELSRRANTVQTPRATPARPANMVGVCFLLQVLTAESLNCPLRTSSPVIPCYSTALHLLLSLVSMVRVCLAYALTCMFVR